MTEKTTDNERGDFRPASGPSELAMLGYELDGVLADVREGKGFDNVCRMTLERVSARLHTIGRLAVAAPSRSNFPKPAGYVSDIADGASFWLTDEDDVGIAVYTRPQIER